MNNPDEELRDQNQDNGDQKEMKTPEDMQDSGVVQMPEETQSP